MKRSDSIILENLYVEMAYGFSEGSRPMNISQIMDFVIQNDKKRGNKTEPFSFTSITNPAVYKKTFPYKNLYKVTQTTGELGEYQKEVNRQLVQRGEEGNFEAGAARTIKQIISPSVAITTRDNPVLRFNSNFVKNTVSLYVLRDNDGSLREISKEEAQKYMRPSSGGKFDTNVKWRTYGFDKMVGLRIGGTEIVNTEIDEDKMEVFDFGGHQLRS